MSVLKSVCLGPYRAWTVIVPTCVDSLVQAGRRITDGRRLELDCPYGVNRLPSVALRFPLVNFFVKVLNFRFVVILELVSVFGVFLHVRVSYQ